MQPRHRVVPGTYVHECAMICDGLRTGLNNRPYIKQEKKKACKHIVGTASGWTGTGSLW